MKRNWPYSPLGELVQMRSGGTPSRGNTAYWNGTIPWFSGKDLKSFYLRDSIEHISENAVGKGTRTVGAGALLVLVRGMTLMKEVPVGVTLRDASFNQDVKALLPDPEKLDVRFLGYFLRCENHRLKDCVTTAGHGTGRLPLESLEEYPVPTPPLPEQKRIADILNTWDEALEKLDALIAAKASRKQALVQQLLTGKLRLAGFSNRWPVCSLADLLDPIVRIVPKPDGSFLAAGIRSHGKGVFLKPDFEAEDIALDELFEIRTGDFIINITFAWEGAAAIVPETADGALVSHRFPTYRIREPDADLSFIRHYILTKKFVFDCGLASPGGAGRNRVLSKSAFMDIELAIPNADEQRAIGSVLDTADAELRLLRQQRAALDQQKRGLMQQLLSGKVRVSI